MPRGKKEAQETVWAEGGPETRRKQQRHHRDGRLLRLSMVRVAVTAEHVGHAKPISIGMRRICRLGQHRQGNRSATEHGCAGQIARESSRWNEISQDVGENTMTERHRPRHQ